MCFAGPRLLSRAICKDPEMAQKILISCFKTRFGVVQDSHLRQCRWLLLRRALSFLNGCRPRADHPNGHRTHPHAPDN